jgi:hypothetical protein
MQQPQSGVTRAASCEAQRTKSWKKIDLKCEGQRQHRVWSWDRRVSETGLQIVNQGLCCYCGYGLELAAVVHAAAAAVAAETIV